MAVIGLGYVGLPLAEAFTHADLGSIIGLDIDSDKISLLNKRSSYIGHIADQRVSAMLDTGRFEPSCDFQRLAKADAVLICVPTPLTPQREPDLQYVETTCRSIASHLTSGTLVVLESTTYPFTTRNLVLPILETSGLTHNTDFLLAYSPEREDPGRKDTQSRQVPKLVGGLNEAACQAAVNLYSRAFAKVIPVSSAETAEAAKLLENIYRSVNIALVNEMKMVLAAMGIDIWEVIEAASTKPFGFQRFDPGPGLGGHCVPIDPYYLAWKAREFGVNSRFIELAGAINHDMPDYVVRRLVLGLNSRQVAAGGARVLMLGLAYKPDVDDLRESPSLVLIEKLTELGAAVDYHDPHIPQTRKVRRHDLKLTSVPLTPEAVGSYDAVVIATHHSAIDWAMVARHARLIIDTRGVMRRYPDARNRVVDA